jgi:hypothetical protein
LNHEQFELLHLPFLGGEREAAEHQARWDAYFALGSPLADAVSSPAWQEWIAQQSRRRQLAEEQERLDRRLADSPTASPCTCRRLARRPPR